MSFETRRQQFTNRREVLGQSELEQLSAVERFTDVGSPATSATARRPCPVSLQLPPLAVLWTVGALVLTYLEVLP
jgi:hypothetical protein